MQLYAQMWCLPVLSLTKAAVKHLDFDSFQLIQVKIKFLTYIQNQ